MIRAAQQPDSLAHVRNYFHQIYVHVGTKFESIFAKIKVINNFGEFMNTPKVSGDD
jgi:hypothetical protein